MSDNNSVQTTKPMNINKQTNTPQYGSVLTVIIIVGNSIALAVFLRKTFRVKKSNYLVVSLTIADLLVGVSYGILSAMGATRDNISVLSGHVDENSSMQLKLLWSSINASVYTLSAISVERVLAVFWPFHHRLAQRWQYFTAIALVWIVSGLPVFLNERLLSKEPSWFSFADVIVTSVALLTIFISYLSIWIKMKFFTKFRNCRTIQENSKLTKTLFIVTVVSLGTWLPRLLLEWVGRFIYDIPETEGNITLSMILLMLLVSNSFWNVIVYSVRMPEFRRELRQIFCKYL